MPASELFQLSYHQSLLKIFNESRRIKAKWDALKPNEFYDCIKWKAKKKLLTRLLLCFEADGQTLKHPDALVKFLAYYWEKTQGTFLSYTAEPDSELTCLLCDIAEMESKRRDVPAIALLMPGLATESAIDAYEDLDTLELKTTLVTHVLGGEDGCRYLIPVRCILDVISKPKNECFNPYFDYETMAAESALLQDPERERLISHSKETHALYDIAEQKNFIEKNETDLLSKLNQLCRVLRINDAHGGRGQQESAGEGAYAAIALFSEYYGQLSDDAKAIIPEAVLNQIQRLLTLASTEGAVNDIASCIGTRREELSKVMNDHAEILQEINFDKATSESQVQNARNNLESAIENMKSLLEKKRYRGYDKLGIQIALLKEFNAQFNVTSIDTFNIFMRCAPQDMLKLFEYNPLLGQQISEQLNNVDAIAELIVSDHEIDKLRVVLPYASRQILQCAEYWSSLLTPLNAERCKLVCIILQDHLNKAVESGKEFAIVLKDLTQENRTEVFNQQKARFVDIINTGQDFYLVLKFLTEEQRAEVFNQQKGRWNDIIKSGRDFALVLYHLTEDQRADVSNQQKARLDDLIKSGSDFYNVISFLSPEHYTQVFNEYESRLDNIVKSALDFGHVLLGLRWNDFKSIFNGLCQLFIPIEDLGAVLNLFPEPRKFNYVCKTLQPQIMRSAQCFRDILQILDPQRREWLFNLLKENLGDIIKSSNDFRLVLEFLTEEKRTQVFEQQKGRLNDLINSSEDFIFVINLLTEEQCEQVLDQQKDRLDDFIKSGTDFCNVIMTLSPGQYTQVFNKYELHLDSIITSAVDFGCVLQHIRSRHFEQVFSRLQPHFIQTAEHLGLMLNFLPKQRFVFVCNAMQSQIMSSSYYFGSILQELNLFQRECLFDLQKAYLIDIIKTGLDFFTVLEFLTKAQRVEVFNQQKARLNTFIRSGRDFYFVMKSLNDEQRAEVFNKQKARLRYILRSYQDFKLIFRCLSPEQCSQALNELKGHFDKCSIKLHELANIISLISPDKFDELLDSLGEQCLSKTFKSGRSLYEVSDNPLYREKIFNKLQPHFTNCIKTTTDLADALKGLSLESGGKLYEEVRPRLIKTGNDFWCATRKMKHDAEMFSVVFNKQKDHFHDVIISSDDLRDCLRGINIEYYPKVLEALQDISSIIKSGDDLWEIIQPIKLKAQRVALINNLVDHLGSEKFKALCNQLGEQAQRDINHLLTQRQQISGKKRHRNSHGFFSSNKRQKEVVQQPRVENPDDEMSDEEMKDDDFEEGNGYSSP